MASESFPDFPTYELAPKMTSWTDDSGRGAHVQIDVGHSTRDAVQWVQEYAAGRKEFRDTHIEHARSSIAAADPAGAIVCSRLAVEIPSRGRSFIFDQNVVIRAMGMEFSDAEPIPTGQNRIDRAIQVDRRRDKVQSDAMQQAFGTPYELITDLEEIASVGREEIKGREIKAFTDAVTTFDTRGELFSAGVGALELGVSYEEQVNATEAIEAYKTATELLRQHSIDVTNRDNPVRHRAEVDELKDRIVDSLGSVVRLYTDLGRAKGADKETVKTAVYGLDDLGASRETVQQGYEFLASLSHFGEKRFYVKEAAAIAGELAVDKFFDENPTSVWMGAPAPRRDRRQLRP
ncbi:MAG TPA: hypothetical protein VF575_02700 [Candidatus Saccharimonadales bacterium]|jgi:hypothetical protein